jgi:hypothetical protein
LQQGLLGLVKQKLSLFSDDLESAMRLLDGQHENEFGLDSDYIFLRKRLARARQLQERLKTILDNPIVRYLGKK